MRVASVLLAVVSVCATLAAVEWFARRWYATFTHFIVSSKPGLIYEMPPNAAYFNKLGYRGPTYDEPPATTTCRVLVLGDSVAAGQGTPNDAETFVRITETLLNERAATATMRYEFFNAAVPGYNIEQIASNYEFKARHHPHDVVAYAFFLNDFDVPDGIYTWDRPDRLLLAMKPHDGQLWSPPLVPAFADEYFASHSRAYLFLRSRLYFTFGLPAIQKLDWDTVKKPTRFSMSRRQLERLKRLVEAQQHPLVMWLAPMLVHTLTYEECNARIIDGTKDFCVGEQDPYNYARQYAREMQIPLTDLHAAYTKNRGKDFRQACCQNDWAHPNAEGNRAIAEELVSQWHARGLDTICRDAVARRAGDAR